MAHGFTVEGGLGADGSVIPHDSSAHSVLVPDTELLFTAQFHRAGPDLVLTGRDGQHHLIPGYFASEHHPALVAPNGAHLSPDTVDLLAGSAMPGHYAQAQPTTPPDAIGKIEKVVGDVTVVRNGATVALHVGDAVFKSDVVQTGASASCGISFPDGTVLNLVANTRMALNEYAYDANSNGNGALFTLVEGTFAFVAGKVAHTGDMKIATPVATMGIRGTTGVVEEQPNAPATITAQASGHTYTFAVMPDIGTGITGMWDVYLTDANGIIQRDANGNPIVLVTVSQSGYVTYLTPQGLGQPPLVSTEPATNSQYAFEQEMLHQLFLTLNPLNQPNGNNGSSTTPPPFELPNPIPQLLENGNTNINLNGTSGNLNGTGSTPDTIPSTGPLTVVIWIANSSGLWNSGQFWLGGSAPSSPQEVIIPDHHVLTKVTTVGADSAAGLEVDNNSVLNIVSGTSFTIYDFIHGAGTVQLNASGSDPTLFIHGAVPLVGGGTIKMIGAPGDNYILGAPGTGAVLINVDYTIEGTGTIGGGDGNLTFENFGTVNANNGVLTVNTGNQVYNDGLMEATVDPVAATIGTLWIQDSVVNAGTVQANGGLAIVELWGATFDNLFSVVAENLGSISFFNVAVTNEAISATNPAGGTINAAGGFITFYGGSIANNNVMEATDGGLLRLENITVTNSSAAELTIGAFSDLSLESAAVLGGTIENAGNVVTGGTSEINGDTVINNGTIGVYSDGSLTLEGTTLTNAAGATILAADGGSVDIEINNANTINDGTIKAVGGKVTIDVNADGSRNNGTIEADNGAVIINSNNGGGGGGGGGGGVDAGGNYGTITALDSGTVTINGGITNHTGATIDAIGTVSTVNFSEGETDNLGTIEADETGARVFFTDGMLNNANLIVAENGGEISLTSIMLTNDPGAFFEATSGGSITWNTGGVNNDGMIEADHNGTITFDGSIGITNDSDGKIEALSGGSIVFETTGTGSVSNNGGLILASGGGTITFDSTLNGGQNTGTIEAGAGGTIIIDGFEGGNGLFNGGGTIEANGTGALVELAGANIIGGTLQTSNSGIIETITNSGAATTTVFDGVTNEGYVLVNDNTSLVLRDTIHNGGTISLALSGQSDLKIDGTVTLLGGFVEMNTSGDEITALAAGASLVNSGIIRGQGQIGSGDGKLTIAGSGVILADLAGKTLTIDTGSTVTDSGELSALNGGTLKIEDSINNYEVISSQGLGSDVELSGATLDDAGGSLSADENGTMTLTGVAVTNENSGTISTFESGQIFFSGGSVTNNGSRIETLLNGSITFENGVSVTNDFASIEALSGSIIFDSSAGSVINKDGGVIEASLFGTIIFGAITVTNSGGTIEALGTQGDVDFNAAVDLNGTTINGGTLETDSAGVIDALTGTSTFDGVTIAGGLIKAETGATVDLEDKTTVSGTVTLEGGGTFVLDPGVASIVGGSAGGTLDIAVGATLAGSGNIGNAGTPSATALTLDNNGTIDANVDGCTLTIHTGNIVTNAGTLEATNGGTLQIDDSVDNESTGVILATGTDSTVSITFNGGGVNNSGMEEAVAGGTLNLTDDSGGVGNNSGGTIKADAGTVSITGGVDNDGMIKAVDGGTLTVTVDNTNNNNGGVGNFGTIEADDGTVSIIATVSDAIVLNSGNGTIEAVHCGVVSITGVTINNEGRIVTESGGSITIKNSTVDNSGGGDTGGIGTDGGGTITIDCSHVVNCGDIGSSGSGAITIAYSTVCNNGEIGADTGGTITFERSHIVNNDHIGTGDNLGSSVGPIGTIIFDHSYVVNNGSFDSGHNGEIDIDCSTIDNTCGTIQTGGPDGGNSSVQLSNATIIGGTLATLTGGIIETVADSGVSTLSGVAIDDGSILKADTGSSLDLEDTTTINGTVTFEGGGTFMLDDPPVVASIVAGATGGTLDIAADATLTGSGDIGDAGSTSLTLNNAGTIDADGDGAAIDIETGNTITNTGLIEATDQGSLEIDDSVNNYGATPGTIKASGGGSITLLGTEVDSGSTTAGVAGGTIEADASSSIEFDNVTIGLGSSVASGGGTLDAAGGTITVNNGELDIGSATSGGAGTLEATCDGSITLNGVTVENFGGGKIEATHGGSITFDGGTLNDGSATADVAGGLVEATNCGTITFNNATVNIGAAASGGSGGTVEASHGGTINFEGATTTNAGGTIEALRDGAIVFDGGTLDDSSETADIAGGTVEATAACATFMFNNVGITLDSAVAGGGGTIKASNGGAITFNGGTINSNASAPTSGGTIEALSCGTIRFNSTNIYNQGSSIEADGVGAMIMLAGAMILGGTLETSASGIIETVADTGNTTFDGVTIATGSTIQVDDGTSLTLQDTADGNATVTNDGTITLVQGCDPSLIVNGDITLAGSGTVVLSGDTDSIVGGKGADTDTLSSANTIEGAGTIGGEGLIFSNLAGGVVDADVSGHTLVLDTGTTVTNLGTLEATNGGTLEIHDNVCNVGGTIAAYGCGSVVELEGVTIKGGMFLTDDSTSGDGGIIDVVSSDSATVFDGGSSHAISIGGFVQVDAGATLKLIGTIDLAAHSNNGTIDLAQISTDGGAIGADLVICGTVTLTGSGGITMQGHAAQITAAAPGAALDNGSTISGAGSIGTGNDWLHLVNETAGVINADNASADSLTIDIGCNTIVNHGLLEATGGGTLDVVSHVDNSCGSLLATSGGVLDIESTICGGTATIHGATLEFAASSNVNVTFDNGSVDSPTYGTLVLGDPADFSGTISNFTGTCPDANHSDTIDLADFKACNTMLHATYNGDDGITSVCVVDTTDDLSVTLKLAGKYTTDNFTIASDGKGGIDIYDPPTAGAKDTSSAVTTASSNDHATAPADQNATDHAAGPANEAGFLGDQGSPSTAQDGTAAAPVNQLALAGDTVTAPPSTLSAAGDSDLAGFGSGHGAVSPAGPAPGSTLSAGAIQVSTGASQIAIVVPGAPVLDSEHLTDSTIVDGSGTPDSEATSSTAPTAPANEHAVAPATVTTPAPATSPTLASASLGGPGNDSFAFHPNLGSDTAQNAGAHTNELAHNDIQVAGPALAPIAPEFHQEFAFDAIHQDAANVAATVDQFHQMAANSTLLH